MKRRFDEEPAERWKAVQTVKALERPRMLLHTFEDGRYRGFGGCRINEQPGRSCRRLGALEKSSVKTLESAGCFEFAKSRNRSFQSFHVRTQTVLECGDSGRIQPSGYYLESGQNVERRRPDRSQALFVFGAQVAPGRTRGCNLVERQGCGKFQP